MSRSSSPSSQATENGVDVILHAEPALTPPSSDIDSDMDPETMTERYIGLQTRLYELDPDLDTTERRIRSKHSADLHIASRKGLQPQLVRVLRRLDRLKSDILFDRYEAEQRWIKKRTELARATAQRKKLQLDERASSDISSPDRNDEQVTPANRIEEVGGDSQEDGGAEAFGEFFSGLSDISKTDGHGAADSDIQNTIQQPTTVRDFGKWNGISPRRTFEEACRARSVFWEILLL